MAIASAMAIQFVALFVLGLGMLVRGLMTVSTARAAWMARIIPATANVIACGPVSNSETGQLETFTISVEYTDADGKAHTADLPASERREAGDPIDIRFDPKRPTSVYLSEQFEGTNLPAASSCSEGF